MKGKDVIVCVLRNKDEPEQKLMKHLGDKTVKQEPHVKVFQTKVFLPWLASSEKEDLGVKEMRET